MRALAWAWGGAFPGYRHPARLTRALFCRTIACDQAGALITALLHLGDLREPSGSYYA